MRDVVIVLRGFRHPQRDQSNIRDRLKSRQKWLSFCKHLKTPIFVPRSFEITWILYDTEMILHGNFMESINGIHWLINGITCLIHAVNQWLGGPGQGPQPFISRARPFINRVLPLINRSMQLMNELIIGN